MGSNELPSLSSHQISLKDASGVLQSRMKDLHTEITKAEHSIQDAINVLWQKVLKVQEQKIMEWNAKYSLAEEENNSLKNQVDSLTQKKTEVECENVELLLKLEQSNKERRFLTEQLESIKLKLKCKEDEVKAKESRLMALEMDHANKIVSFCSKDRHQEKLLKEHQNKLQSMVQQLTAERMKSEKTKKSYSSQIAKQLAESKKMAIELTNLKSQVSCSNAALITAKEFASKLQQQLKRTADASELAKADSQKHLCTVSALKHKIMLLEKEIKELKVTHNKEIDKLKEQHTGDFMDARIAFLQYQNRQEKMKLHFGSDT